MIALGGTLPMAVERRARLKISCSHIFSFCVASTRLLSESFSRFIDVSSSCDKRLISEFRACFADPARYLP